jgi:hypothetical protein
MAHRVSGIPSSRCVDAETDAAKAGRFSCAVETESRSFGGGFCASDSLESKTPCP